MDTRTPTPARWSRRRWLSLAGIGVAVVAVAAVVYTAVSPAPGPSADAGSAVAPASFTATTGSGQQVTVPGGGKPSVLLFFSASCGTCGPAAHALAQAQHADPQAAHYAAVDMDPTETPDVIQSFLRDHQADTLGVTSDRDATLTSTYGIAQLSTVVTLDPAGQVVSRAFDPNPSQIEAGLAQARTP